MDRNLVAYSLKWGIFLGQIPYFHRKFMRMKKAFFPLILFCILSTQAWSQIGIRVDCTSPIIAASQGTGNAWGGEFFVLRNSYGIHIAAEYKESDSTLFSFNGDTLRDYGRHRWSIGSEYFAWSFQEREGTGLFLGGRVFVDYLLYEDRLNGPNDPPIGEKQTEWGFGANLSGGYNLGIGRFLSVGVRGGWNFYFQTTQQRDRFWGYAYLGIGI